MVSNNNYQTKIATLALPTRETFVSATVWQRRLGAVLYTAELNLNSALAHEFTQAVTNTIQYSPLLASTNSHSTTEEVLQDLLLEVNKVLEPRRRLFGNPLAPRYHLALGVISGSSLAVAGIGHMNALVVSSATQVSNLFTTSPQGKKQHESIFRYVITGKLETRETFLLAGNAIFDYVSLAKISALATEHQPGMLLRELEKIVTTPTHHPPLAIIGLRLEEALSSSAPLDSLARLVSTQKAVNTVLKPSVISLARNLFKRQTKTSSTLSKPIKTEPAAETNNDLPTAKSRAIGLVSPKEKVKKTIQALARLRDRDYLKNSLTLKIESWLRVWRVMNNWKRVLFVAGLLALVVFSQSVVIMGRRRLTAQDSYNYNLLVTNLIETYAATESALLYKDVARAQTLLAESLVLLKQLPSNNKERLARYDSFNKKYNDLTERIWQRFVVKHFPVVIELDSSFLGQKVLYINKKLYLVSASGELAVWSGKNNEQIFKIPSDWGQLKSIYQAGSEILINAEKTQAVFNPLTRSTVKLSSAFIFKDFTTYDGKWYFLSNEPVSIYRAIRQEGKLTVSKPWLKPGQESNIVGSTTLAVDGSIYTINQGTVKKFIRGALQSVAYESSNFTFGPDSLIRSLSELDKLYVFSTKGKYFVLYNTKGKLLLQLDLSGLKTFTDLVVDASGRELFVLADNRVYRLALSDYSQ